MLKGSASESGEEIISTSSERGDQRGDKGEGQNSLDFAIGCGWLPTRSPVDWLLAIVTVVAGEGGQGGHFGWVDVGGMGSWLLPTVGDR